MSVTENTTLLTPKVRALTPILCYGLLCVCTLFSVARITYGCWYINDSLITCGNNATDGVSIHQFTPQVWLIGNGLLDFIFGVGLALWPLKQQHGARYFCFTLVLVLLVCFWQCFGLFLSLVVCHHHLQAEPVLALYFSCIGFDLFLLFFWGYLTFYYTSKSSRTYINNLPGTEELGF